MVITMNYDHVNDNDDEELTMMTYDK
jgi:hypothetical protein